MGDGDPVGGDGDDLDACARERIDLGVGGGRVGPQRGDIVSVEKRNGTVAAELLGLGEDDERSALLARARTAVARM